MARNPLSPYRSAVPAGRPSYPDPFLSLHREMNRLFDDVLRAPFDGIGVGNGMVLSPHIDVSETEGEIWIVAELPGVPQDDVHVTLDDDVLTISGEKKTERRDDKESYHVSERSFGSFRRSLRLPYPVDPDAVRTDFDHGVLSVTLPKGRERDRSRRIEVSQGKASSAEGATTTSAAGSEGSQTGEKAAPTDGSRPAAGSDRTSGGKAA